MNRHEAWSIAASRWGPGRTTSLGHTIVCSKMWPSRTPGPTPTTTWSWCASAAWPWRSTNATSIFSRSYHYMTPRNCPWGQSLCLTQAGGAQDTSARVRARLLNLIGGLASHWHQCIPLEIPGKVLIKSGTWLLWSLSEWSFVSLWMLGKTHSIHSVPEKSVLMCLCLLCYSLYTEELRLSKISE